jgi:hypothetical protein
MSNQSRMLGPVRGWRTQTQTPRPSIRWTHGTGSCTEGSRQAEKTTRNRWATLEKIQFCFSYLDSERKREGCHRPKTQKRRGFKSQPAYADLYLLPLSQVCVALLSWVGSEGLTTVRRSRYLRNLFTLTNSLTAPGLQIVYSSGQVEASKAVGAATVGSPIRSG